MAEIEQGKADPVSFVDTACMFHILTFVFGEPDLENFQQSETESDDENEEDYLNKDVFKEKARINESLLPVYKAMRLFRDASLVSCGWKKILDETISKFAGGLKVRVNHGSFGDLPAFSWLCRRKMKIHCLCSGRGCQVEHEAQLIKELLAECDTYRLSSATIHIEIAADNENRRREAMTQQAIADHSPNLENLTIYLWSRNPGSLEGNAEEPFNSDLLALPSLRLVNVVDKSNDSRLLPQLLSLLQNLPFLEYLRLESPYAYRARQNVELTMSSLKYLDVVKFPEKEKLQVACPNLKVFVYKGPVELTLPEACVARMVDVLPPLQLRARSDSESDDEGPRRRRRRPPRLRRRDYDSDLDSDGEPSSGDDGEDAFPNLVQRPREAYSDSESSDED